VTEPGPEGATRPITRSAVAVGSGIFLSRISGFVRDVVIGAFFGTGIAVAAYNAALRIPNVVRNLLGEGTLSASFVPVYSSMLEDAEPEEARRLARSVLGLVVALAGLLSALGVLLAPVLTWLVIPAAEPELMELTTGLVRILFPMAGVMIVGAWALGVLNSHRRFLLPFAAPVMWNLAQIGGLLLGRWAGWEPLVFVLAWSTLVGSFLQLGVQLPEVRKLVGGLRPLLRWAWEPVRRVARNAMPVVASQGVFQLSSWLDFVLASFLPPAALAGLYYAQRLAYLPLSLFGVSVAAASLPEMSRDTAGEALRRRLVDGFFQILYFVFPAAVAFILFGDLMVAVLFERGQFDAVSTSLVATILVAYSLGLVATSSVKLFASGFHALQDTRTPLKYAAVSVLTGAGLGAAFMFGLRAMGLGALAVSGLILGGALGAWLNLSLLWKGLSDRVGGLFERNDLRRVLRYAAAGAVAGGVGVWLRPLLDVMLPGGGLLAQAGVLTGTLLGAGVPYLLIAGRPPTDTLAVDGPVGTDQS
jgi:putative peptidoglycan lipid II flippase